jgi:urea-proton symporter
MDKKKYSIYILGTFQLGIGFGIVTLLSRWVTGNTILSSPEALIKYGILGGLGYSLMGAFAFIAFGFIATYIRKRYPLHQTIGDLLKEKTTPVGYWYTIFLLLVTGMDSMFVQATGAAILFSLIFPVPLYISLFFFFSFCFIIAGLGGMQRIQQFSGISIGFIFAAVIFIPVYFYIQNGVYPVYEGVKLYHPYLLYWRNIDTFYFVITGIIIGFGQVLIDRATWQRVYMLKKNRIRSIFTLTGLIWATIPLSLSSLLLVVVYSGSFHDVKILLFQLIYKINSSLLIAVFVLFCFSAISSTLNAELHATTVLTVKNAISEFIPLDNQHKFRLSYWITGMQCLVLYLVVIIISPTFIELLFFFGSIYAALISPVLWMIFSRDRLSGFVPLTSAIAILISFLFSSSAGHLGTIWISFITSTFLCGCYMFLRFLSFLRKVQDSKL